MPHATQISQYSHVPETKEDLDWADLANIDLSTYGTDEGNAALAQQLIEAVDRQFALGQAFYELPLEEKLKKAGAERGLKDKVEVWNMATNDGHITQPVPDLLKEHIDEIETFAESLYEKVLNPLNHLIALALELPPRLLHQAAPLGRARRVAPALHEVRQVLLRRDHQARRRPLVRRAHRSGDHHPALPPARRRAADPRARDGPVEVGQAPGRELDGQHVRCAKFPDGRVYQVDYSQSRPPPADQRHVDRLGLLYFSRPQNDVVLKTIDSPVLQRAGFTQNEFEAGGHPVPTMGEFTQRKQKWQQAKAKDHQYAKDGEEIVPGFKGQYFK
ncbi:uncharacterized protein PG986_002299 [Apiospora aurea]|uniref:Uncharacterized protein n=1 Tax=Apiospora aurea TaxID=335848 RepID=A0ABR1QZ83_9PEZI